MQIQGDSETVDTFVTALYVLAEHCNYRLLHNELICDKITVGLRDRQLSERMKLDKDLTLESADVTVLPHAVYKELFKNSHPPTLTAALNSLKFMGPGRNPLDVVVIIELPLRKGDTKVLEEVYVLRHLHTALLGRPA